MGPCEREWCVLIIGRGVVITVIVLLAIFNMGCVVFECLPQGGRRRRRGGVSVGESLL